MVNRNKTNELVKLCGYVSIDDIKDKHNLEIRYTRYSNDIMRIYTSYKDEFFCSITKISSILVHIENDDNFREQDVTKFKNQIKYKLKQTRLLDEMKVIARNTFDKFIIDEFKIDPYLVTLADITYSAYNVITIDGLEHKYSYECVLNDKSIKIHNYIYSTYGTLYFVGKALVKHYASLENRRL